MSKLEIQLLNYKESYEIHNAIGDFQLANMYMELMTKIQKRLNTKTKGKAK
jgi:hypothetical protein